MRTTKTAKRIRGLFETAHNEGRAVLGHEEFLLLASLAKLTARDIQNAIADDLLRKGMTGYWIREAADPGAVLVFRNAMRASDDAQEAA